METTEHQEWRSRQRLDVAAAIKAALISGLIFFIMSGGSPWSTAGTMNMVMGRDLPLGEGGSWGRLWMLAFGHFGVALVYMFIIAAVTHRLITPLAVPLGVLTGIALYGGNFVLFHALGFTMQSPESVTIFVHLVFSLTATLIFKAMSVPVPTED